jgi:hypothetical protein
LKISLAVGLGFGITSCSYFLALLMVGPKLPGVIIPEFGILVSLIFVYLYAGKVQAPDKIEKNEDMAFLDPRLKRILSVGFYSVLILAFTNFVNMGIHLPHGGWDGWAIWNLHARFIFRGGEYWRDAFSGLMAPNHHPDYPLLLPLAVVRCWSYIGRETQAVPMLIAMLFTFATAGMLCSGLTILRSRSQGILASLILLGTTIYIVLGTNQLADIPISFFFLASMVLLFLQERFPENYGLSFLAGAMAGFSGWTKNEGLLFLVALFAASISVIYFAQNRKVHMKQLTYLVLGSMPVLAIIIYFKMNLVPANEIIYGQAQEEIIGKLMDYKRYMQILKTFLVKTILTLPYVLLLLFYPLFAGIKIEDKSKISVLTASIALTLMMTGYFFVYLITPYDLDWHLRTSLPRLLAQLWPSILFTYFMIVRTPEEALLNSKFEVTEKLI